MAGGHTSHSLPTNLSVIRDDDTVTLLTDAGGVIAQVEIHKTKALSPESTLPMGASFSWIAHVAPTPPSSNPTITGRISPTIRQEALCRTLN